GRIVCTFRETAISDDAAVRIAERVRQAIWRELATPPPESPPETAPLAVRMHDAALMLSGSPESWREIEAQVAAARAAAPDDPALAIMHAMGLYARLIQNMPPSAPEEWSAAEDEIESVVFTNLPRLQDHPILKLGAAKLLLFIDRGHI